MNRQAVVDDLGRVRGLLPKGYRKAPAGNFEAGPRDNEGIRHIQGTYHVERITVSAQDLELCYGDFPLDWIS